MFLILPHPFGALRKRVAICGNLLFRLHPTNAYTTNLPALLVGGQRHHCSLSRQPLAPRRRQHAQQLRSPPGQKLGDAALLVALPESFERLLDEIHHPSSLSDFQRGMRCVAGRMDARRDVQPMALPLSVAAQTPSRRTIRRSKGGFGALPGQKALVFLRDVPNRHTLPCPKTDFGALARKARQAARDLS